MAKSNIVWSLLGVISSAILEDRRAAPSSAILEVPEENDPICS
jgi:hypothetical protein